MKVNIAKQDDARTIRNVYLATDRLLQVKAAERSQILVEEVWYFLSQQGNMQKAVVLYLLMINDLWYILNTFTDCLHINLTPYFTLL